MNPLLDGYPQVRRALYTLQFAVTTVLGLIAVGFAAAGEGLPQWYAVVLAVSTAAWAALGLTASQHVQLSRKGDEDYAAVNDPNVVPDLARGEEGEAQVGLISLIIVVLLVVIVCILVF